MPLGLGFGFGVRVRCLGKAKVDFFRRTQTFCKHCALTISDIVMRFFPTNGERNREKIQEANFLISSCGQVRNRINSKIIGFSKTARYNSLKINGKSQFLKSEAKICGLFSTLHADRQNLKKNRFFQFLIFALLIFSAERVSKSDHVA